MHQKSVYNNFRHTMMTSTEISRLLKIEYKFCRKTLAKLTEEREVHRVENRYSIYDVLTYFYTGDGDPPIKKTIEQGVLSVSEAHLKIAEKLVPIHIKTVLRKLRNKEIPSYKVGNNVYRVPVSELNHLLENRLIKYTPKPRRTNGGGKNGNN